MYACMLQSVIHQYILSCMYVFMCVCMYIIRQSHTSCMCVFVCRWVCMHECTHVHVSMDGCLSVVNVCVCACLIARMYASQSYLSQSGHKLPPSLELTFLLVASVGYGRAEIANAVQQQITKLNYFSLQVRPLISSCWHGISQHLTSEEFSLRLTPILCYCFVCILCTVSTWVPLTSSIALCSRLQFRRRASPKRL